MWDYLDPITFASLKRNSTLQRHQVGEIYDIQDGEIYKEHVLNSRLGSLYQTSYCLAIDGVQ